MKTLFIVDGRWKEMTAQELAELQAKSPDVEVTEAQRPATPDELRQAPVNEK